MRSRTEITISLPDDLFAHIRAVAPGGELSGYVEWALRAQQLRDVAPAVSVWRRRSGHDTEELTGIFGTDIA